MNNLNNSAKKSIYFELITVAREMRAQPTEAEKILWERIRNKQLGVRFRRQHPIDRFVTDFCCMQLKLVVEVDGDIHKSQKNRDYDRDTTLSKLGYRILRLTNKQVITDVEYATNVIRLEIKKLSLN